MHNGWDIKLLHDGSCPICRREIAALQRRDRNRRVAFEDITAADFDPRRYGVTQEQVMAVMHGVLPDGRVVRGMEVFRRAYTAVGLGWLVAPTGWPVLRHGFDGLYRVWAKVRPWLGGGRCREGACEIEKPRES